jgi:outer membrane protein assembly factor BamB
LALDAATLRALHVAPGFEQPGGLALVGERLFVADTAAGTVHILAAADLAALGQMPVGPGPYAVAALPAAGRVFVGLSGGDGVAVLDAATGKLLGTTALGGLGHPQGVVADDTTGRVYAVYALAPRYRQVAILDGTTGAVVGTIRATLDRPMTDVEALALDPERGRLLLGDRSGLLVYDLARGQWMQMLPAPWQGPAPAFGLAVDPARGIVYAASLGDRAGRWTRYEVTR